MIASILVAILLLLAAVLTSTIEDHYSIDELAEMGIWRKQPK